MSRFEMAVQLQQENVLGNWSIDLFFVGDDTGLLSGVFWRLLFREVAKIFLQ
jgi:hypothetical protein